MDIQRIEPEEAKRRLDSGDGHEYLDVRSREEFAAGHAPGAACVPLMHRNPAGPGMVPNAEFLSEVEAKYAKDAKLIVGCLRGGRSMRAVRILLDAGYTNVVDMRGGYDGEVDSSGQLVYPGWARRDLPIVTDAD